MRQLFALVATSFIFNLAVCEQSLAQHRDPEYLQIRNVSGQEIYVSIIPKGRETPRHLRRWQDWETVRVGETKSIRLRGIQPFDIMIRQADGNAVLFRDQYLCTFMDECAIGIWQREMNGQVGAYVTMSNGKREFVPVEYSLPVVAQLNRTKVALDWPPIRFQVAFPGTQPPPPPPPDGPK